MPEARDLISNRSRSIRVAFALAVCEILAAPSAQARHQGYQSQGHSQGAPGAVDYYVLSLTWVPGFCATHHDPNACGRSLGFALHGLWPELERGGYPSHCTGPRLSDGVRVRYQDLYPSPGLIRHEWDKHGACSGLRADAYFQLSDAVMRRVVIPPDLRTPAPLWPRDAARVKQAFLAANPGLPARGIDTLTADGQLSEVRLCVTKTGAFRSCAP